MSVVTYIKSSISRRRIPKSGVGSPVFREEDCGDAEEGIFSFGRGAISLFGGRGDL